MAAESRKISEYKTRVACSYEPWLSVGNSDVTLEIQGKYVEIPTISIFGGRKPVDVVLIVGDNFRAAAEAVGQGHHALLCGRSALAGIRG